MLYDIISEAGLNNGMDKMQFGNEALVQWTHFFKVEQFGDNFGFYIERDRVFYYIVTRRSLHILRFCYHFVSKFVPMESQHIPKWKKFLVLKEDSNKDDKSDITKPSSINQFPDELFEIFLDYLIDLKGLAREVN
ncbi:4813_t:CDS:2 [Entrophospora sp. SA101]|nr:4813_t:CDS:2 [Entrophospora sp. SA101]